MFVTDYSIKITPFPPFDQMVVLCKLIVFMILLDQERRGSKHLLICCCGPSTSISIPIIIDILSQAFHKIPSTIPSDTDLSLLDSHPRWGSYP